MKQNESFIKAMESISEDFTKLNASEADELVTKTLKEYKILGVKKSRKDRQKAPYCPNGWEYRTCYWVEHGDGTKSDEWCTNYGCE